jgi:uncharacterized protein YjbJ (UPF0337 family)
MDNTPGRMRDDASDVTGRATDDTRDEASGDSGNVEERTREIRSEIEQTRVEMTETIDAIQEKLTPRNIVANATDRVKNAATERVREMADTASDTAQQAMDYARGTASGMTDRMRQNPIPLALIGVGAAWLLARSRRPSYGRGSYGMRRDQRDYGRVYGEDLTRDEALYGDNSEHGLMAKIRNNPIPAALAGVGLSWLVFSSNEPGYGQYGARWGEGSTEGSWTGGSEGRTGQGGMAQNLTGSANQIASRTREYASEATDSMRRMVRRRQSQLQHMVQDNPLLVGAGALMLGAAFGMAVPETDTENELMGDARDNVVERARDMARDAASQVQNAAGSVADAAGKLAGNSPQ